MTSGDAQPELPPGQDAPDWVAVGIGIMTIATIVAVATAAAAIALANDYAKGEVLAATAAAGFAAASLAAYFGVIVTGLSTLFLESSPERKERIKGTASFLIFQIATVVAFAFIAIFGPLVAGAGPADSAPANCPVLPKFPVC